MTAPHPQPPDSATPGATRREQIVTTAVAIADTDGLEAVSMRRIAARLGAGTMSLYRYVQRKDDLLELMVDAVHAELHLPERPSGDWRADLRLVATADQAMLERHPWLTDLLTTRAPLGPNMLARTEFILATLAGLGLEGDAALAVMRMLGQQVLGMLQAERLPLSTEHLPATQPALEVTAPHLARLLARQTDQTGAQARLGFTLEVLLDGIAAQAPVRS